MFGEFESSLFGPFETADRFERRFWAERQFWRKQFSFEFNFDSNVVGWTNSSRFFGFVRRIISDENQTRANSINIWKNSSSTPKLEKLQRIERNQILQTNSNDELRSTTISSRSGSNFHQTIFSEHRQNPKSTKYNSLRLSAPTRNEQISTGFLPSTRSTLKLNIFSSFSLRSSWTWKSRNFGIDSKLKLRRHEKLSAIVEHQKRSFSLFESSIQYERSSKQKPIDKIERRFGFQHVSIGKLRVE